MFQNDFAQVNGVSPAQVLPAVQCKLEIGTPGDRYEQEADTVADRVMKMPETQHIQRKCSCEEEGIQRKPLASFIQRKENEDRAMASDAVSQQINATRGGGGMMDTPTKSFMESRFGTDFSNVKIHTDHTAVQLNRELNAQAFTVGSDIYFNEGKYVPGSESGKRLLAHELTHTVQQAAGTAVPAVQKQHSPGGPYHAPEGTDLRCSSSDTCSQLSLKINYLRHMIRSHTQWDVANPDPQYPGGRHAQEIAELSNALANCIGHTVRCRNQPEVIPVPYTEPLVNPDAARRVAIATAIGAGIGTVGGAIIGGLGGAGGGTLVAPGVGTVGGGIAGGVGGAAYGAALGGLAGGAIMGGAQALYEWLVD